MPTVADRPTRKGPPLETRLDEQMRGVGRRIRLNDALAGAASVAALALAFAFVVMVADRAYALPLWGRQLLLAGFLGGAGLLTYRRVVRPLTGTVNPRYAARKLEATVADGKNAVINWVDLRDRPIAESVRAAISSGAAKRLAEADPQRATESRELLVYGGIAGGLLAALAALFVVCKPPQFFSLLGRAFAPFSARAIASRTQIELLDPATGNATLTVGQPLTVGVAISGRVPRADEPDRVRVRFRYAADAPYEELEMLATERSREYALRLPEHVVQNGLWFRVAAGDAETPEFRAEVRSRPLLTKFAVRYEYPAYLRMKPETAAEPRLDAYRGTRVTLTAKANRALGGGRITLSGEPNPVPGKVVGEGGDALEFSWVLNDSGSYRVTFAPKDGEVADPSPSYPITVRPDRAPEVAVQTPAERATSLPINGLLAVDATAGDDFGVASVTLKARVLTAAKEIALADRPFQGGKSLKREADGSFPTAVEFKDSFTPSELKRSDGKPLGEAEVGGVLEFWLEAADNCDVPPGPNVGKSPLYKVTLDKALPPPAKKDADAAKGRRKADEQAAAKQQDARLEKEERPAPQIRPENVEPKPGDGKPGEAEPKGEKPGDAGQPQAKPGEAGQPKTGEAGQPKEGQPKPGENGQPQDGQPMPGENGQPQEGQPNPGDAGKPQEGQPKPGEAGKPQEGQPKPGEAGKPQEGQPKPGEAGKPREGQPKAGEAGQPNEPTPGESGTPPGSPQPRPQAGEEAARDQAVREQADQVQKELDKQSGGAKGQPQSGGPGQPGQPNDPDQKPEKQPPGPPRKPGELSRETGKMNPDGSNAEEPPADDVERLQRERDNLNSPDAGKQKAAREEFDDLLGKKNREKLEDAAKKSDPNSGANPQEREQAKKDADELTKKAAKNNAQQKPSADELQKARDKANDLASDDAGKREAAEKEFDKALGEQRRKELQEAVKQSKAGQNGQPMSGEPTGKPSEQKANDLAGKAARNAKGAPKPEDVDKMAQQAKDLGSNDGAKRDAAEKALDQQVGRENREKMQQLSKDLQSGDPKRQQAAKDEIERAMKEAKQNADAAKGGEKPNADELRKQANDLASKDDAKREAAEKALDQKLGQEQRQEMQKAAEKAANGDAAAQKELEQKLNDAQAKAGGEKQPAPTQPDDKTAQQAKDLASKDDSKREAAEKALDQKLGKERREELQKAAQQAANGQPGDQKNLDQKLKDAQAAAKEETAQQAKDLASKDDAKREAAEKALDGKLGKEQRQELQKAAEKAAKENGPEKAAAQKELSDKLNDAQKAADAKAARDAAEQAMKQAEQLAKDLNSPDKGKREAAEKALDDAVGKEKREELQQALKDRESKDAQTAKKGEDKLRQMAEDAMKRAEQQARSDSKGENDAPPGDFRPGPGSARGQEEKVLAEDPKNRLRAAELQLERFEKNRYNAELQKNLKMTPEEYERFLRSYEESVKRQREEVAAEAAPAKEPAGPATIRVGGGNRVEKRGDGTVAGGPAGAGTAPPGYGDALRRFAQDAAKQARPQK